MKIFLSNKKTVITLLVATILLLCFYAYMLARPISYGMAYHNETEYEGGAFEGTMKFYSDKTMVNTNTNFEEELTSRYYYKDGYLFFTMAQTDEEYESEVAQINEDFDAAVRQPFYAGKINAFRIVLENEGYSLVYTCQPAIVFAVVGGLVELALFGVALRGLLFTKKSEKEETQKDV